MWFCFRNLLLMLCYFHRFDINLNGQLIPLCLSGLGSIKDNQESSPRRVKRQQPDVTDGAQVIF